MSGPETKKLDELFRSLPKNTGVDPRLVEAARTELNLLKFHAGAQVLNHKQESWTKTDVEKLQTELQAKDTEIYILKQQILKLKDRGNINPSLRDLSDPNAPVKLRDKYNKLYEIEWNDAYDYFKDKGWNEIETIVTLQRILRASHRFCHDVAIEQLQNIEGEAICPSASWMDDSGIIARMKTKEISREIKNLAKTYQKCTGQKCVSALQKAFISHVLPTFIDPERYFEREISVYTKLCVEISWFMCIQDPPMTFIDRIERGADFEMDFFRKYKNCTGNKFDYLVWPALLLFEGGPLVVKGVAKPIKKKHNIYESGQPETEVPQRKMKMPSYGDVAYTDTTEVDMAARDPEDWVDLRMDDDIDDYDDDSWNRPTPRTPPQVYKHAPVRDDGKEASSPYFQPHDQTTKNGVPAINIIKDTPERENEAMNLDRTKGRKKGSSPHDMDKTDGNLTIQWKKGKNSRMPSAP